MLESSTGTKSSSTENCSTSEEDAVDEVLVEGGLLADELDEVLLRRG